MGYGTLGLGGDGLQTANDHADNFFLYAIGTKPHLIFCIVFMITYFGWLCFKYPL